MSSYDNDTLRVSDTAPLTYSSVANVAAFINDDDNFGNLQKPGTLEDITVVGEEEIIIGTVIEDASSEGLRCIKTYEEMIVQRNDDCIVEEGFQVVSVEEVYENGNDVEASNNNHNK